MRIASYATRRLVLRRSQTLGAVHAVMTECGWPAATDIVFSDLGMREVSWTCSDGLGVYYTDDALERVRAVEVRGNDPTSADQILAGLAIRLEVYSLRDLLQMVDRAKRIRQVRRAVYRLTFGAHPTRAEPAVLDRVEACARHGDPAVRAATAYAMGNAYWAEYRPLLLLLLGDDDSKVRAMAHRVAVAYDETDLPHITGGGQRPGPRSSSALRAARWRP